MFAKNNEILQVRILPRITFFFHQVLHYFLKFCIFNVCSQTVKSQAAENNKADIEKYKLEQQAKANEALYSDKWVSFQTWYLTTLTPIPPWCILPHIWHGMILDPDHNSDQVHQAEPGPSVVQQHQVLLLRPAEWVGLSLQQDPWKRLETKLKFCFGCFLSLEKGL